MLLITSPQKILFRCSCIWSPPTATPPSFQLWSRFLLKSSSWSTNRNYHGNLSSNWNFIIWLFTKCIGRRELNNIHYHLWVPVEIVSHINSPILEKIPNLCIMSYKDCFVNILLHSCTGTVIDDLSVMIITWWNKVADYKPLERKGLYPEVLDQYCCRRHILLLRLGHFFKYSAKNRILRQLVQYIQLCLGSNILEQTLKPVLFLIPWRKNPRIILPFHWGISKSKTQESPEAAEDDHHHAFVPGRLL